MNRVLINKSNARGYGDDDVGLSFRVRVKMSGMVKIRNA
jgi:hypothetical protein